MESILWLKDIKDEDLDKVGRKGLNSAKMSKSGIPVPDGFVITNAVFSKLTKTSGLEESIIKVLKEKTPDGAYNRIKELLIKTGIPWEVEVDLIHAYRKLSKEGEKRHPLALRLSFLTPQKIDEEPGFENKDFLNIQNEEDFLKKVKESFAFAFKIYDFEDEKDGKRILNAILKCSVFVQRMATSAVSGFLFTKNPVNLEDETTVEAVFGISDVLTGGLVVPERYTITENELSREKIAKQEWLIGRDNEGKELRIDIAPRHQEREKLLEGEIFELYRIVERIKKLNLFDSVGLVIKWSYAKKEFQILKVLPLIFQKMEEESEYLKIADTYKAIEEKLGFKPGEAIISGRVSYRGKECGTALVLGERAFSFRKLGEKMILVAKTTPKGIKDMFVDIDGIIMEKGGFSSMGAHLARIKGIPAIVDVPIASKLIKDGDNIFLDANEGVVYSLVSKEEKETEISEAVEVEYIVEPIVEKEFDAQVSEENEVVVEKGEDVLEMRRVEEYLPVEPHPTTATTIMLSLLVPNTASQYASQPVQGVGLLKEEYIISNIIGIHPLSFIEQNKERQFVEMLRDAIVDVTQPFYPRPVILRLCNFTSKEYRELTDGEHFEKDEENPALGLRGTSRYISPKFKEMFKLELEAVKKVRELGFENLWLMLPMVRRGEDAKEALRIMEEVGLRRGGDFKIWIEFATPGMLFEPETIGEFSDGVSINIDEFTKFLHGADPANEVLKGMDYFDVEKDVVKRSIKGFIEALHKYGTEVSISGEQVLIYPDFIEFLIELGIDSVSVSPESVKSASQLVARIEKKILMRNIRSLMGK